MTGHVIGVCGFGRCGSTMVMGMLDAGGIPPVDGSHPQSYELPGLRAEVVAAAAGQPGRAVKLLDYVGHPKAEPIPDGPWRFVWLDRDHVQQALSTTKFLLGMGLIEPFTTETAMRRHLIGLAESYQRDRPEALTALRRLGPVEVLTFERILAQPARAARTLAKLVPHLDRAPAAAVVHRRLPRCLPDISLEQGYAS